MSNLFAPGSTEVMSKQEKEESDQLPEEGPGQQVVDDDGSGGRDDADENAGVPGEEGQQTGNPANAG